LMEMKADVSRLPNELSKMPLVSKQLKIDEISTISKLAKGSTIVPQSVITQAPGGPSSDPGIKQERSDVIVVQKKVKKEVPIKPAIGTQVQLATGTGMALQTAVLYGTSGAKTVQQASLVKTVAPSSSQQQAYTIGMPSTLLDNGSGVYQALQLVPVSAPPSQQVVYWPQVSTVPVGSQIAVVQDNKAKPKGKGVITIDD